jgi:hypothetical protein
MAQAAAKVETASAAPHAAPIIKPSAVTWNVEGFVWRECLVRLPQGLTLQDFNDSPTLWRVVQGDATKALRPLDRIRAVAFNGDWMVEAFVSDADRDQVILAGIRKIDTPKRSVPLFEDDTYRVAWNGAGYAVFRKHDNLVMGGQTFTVPEQAKQHLLSLYPTKRSA